MITDAVVSRLPSRWLNGPLGDVANRNVKAVAAHGSDEAGIASVEYRLGSPSAPTIMAFGGMAHGLMMPIAEFAGILSGLDVTVLFVKDFRQCWYQRGVRGLGRSPESSAAALRDLVPPGSDLRGMVGTSAGGTGALLFGALLDVPHIVAFSPRTRITRSAIRTLRRSGTPVPGFRIRAPFHDMRDLLADHPCADVHVHVGALNQADMIEAHHLDGLPNVRVVEHPIHEHTSAGYLKDAGLLRSVLIDELGLATAS